MARIAIFHPTDPLGHVPGGIDSFIKGILKWAPDDLEYTLFGASSDVGERPIGKTMALPSATGRHGQYIPIIPMQATSHRGKVPLSVRYMFALRSYRRCGILDGFDIFDFHRIEPALLFWQEKRPINITLHADYSILRDKNSDIMWKHFPWLYEALEKRAFNKADRIFAVRRSAVERYARTYPQMAGKFTFIPTWMDSDIYRPAADAAQKGTIKSVLEQRLGIPKGSRLLVSVGRLDHQKDPLLLINAFREAFEQRSDVHLLMVGDGILRPLVEARCKEYGLQNRVHLLGVRRANEIADILRGSDLFVLSSAYEGMSIAVLEALAAGVPVVSTNVGEIDLVLKDGVNGQICRDRTPSAFASAICVALDQLDSTSGHPCESAVIPYRPERVLVQIYENHRRQSALQSSRLSSLFARQNDE